MIRWIDDSVDRWIRGIVFFGKSNDSVDRWLRGFGLCGKSTDSVDRCIRGIVLFGKSTDSLDQWIREIELFGESMISYSCEILIRTVDRCYSNSNQWKLPKHFCYSSKGKVILPIYQFWRFLRKELKPLPINRICSVR